MELLSKTLEVFDSTIEGLMTCSSLTLEAAKLLWVPRALCADSIRLDMISVVANFSLT
jgi:hypothetical protein